MEVVVCHTTIVLQLVISECIDLTETHLISALSTTDDLSAIACVARSTRYNMIRGEFSLTKSSPTVSA